MAIGEHEVGEVHEVYLSYEDGRPTLWDPENRPDYAIRAVWLSAGDDVDRIEVFTDAETVSGFLED